MGHATEFWVNGTSIPDVNWDIGDSWAGLLPISSDPNETRKVRHVLIESATIRVLPRVQRSKFNVATALLLVLSTRSSRQP